MSTRFSFEPVGHAHLLHLSCIDPLAVSALLDLLVPLAMAGHRPVVYLLVVHEESTCQAAFA
jgi:hypothetical protein